MLRKLKHSCGALFYSALSLYGGVKIKKIIVFIFVSFCFVSLLSFKSNIKASDSGEIYDYVVIDDNYCSHFYFTYYDIDSNYQYYADYSEYCSQNTYNGIVDYNGVFITILNDLFDYHHSLSYNEGLINGRAEVFNYIENDSIYSASDIILGIIQAPFDIIQNAFNFEVFGINFSTIITFLISIGIFIFAFRFIRGK